MSIEQFIFFEPSPSYMALTIFVLVPIEMIGLGIFCYFQIKKRPPIFSLWVYLITVVVGIKVVNEYSLEAVILLSILLGISCCTIIESYWRKLPQLQKNLALASFLHSILFYFVWIGIIDSV